jgi:hypothetical protein
MDKIEDALRRDAARIEVAVSPELDERIRASLESARSSSRKHALPEKNSLSLWWASGLTGIAATLLVVVVLNVRQPATQAILADLPAQQSGVMSVERPLLNMEAAVFTAPLEDELSKLESDLKKAEQLVRDELKISF